MGKPLHSHSLGVAWALSGALLLGTAISEQSFGQIGTCETGVAEAYLDINNVRARILNTGGLFWRGQQNVYTVPSDGDVQAIFTAAIWIGGYTGGQLHVAAARYGNFAFWPGPLDEQGKPPVNCAQYDRLFKVSRADIEDFEATGMATSDLRSWPTGLGAPTYAAPANGVDDDRDGTVDEDHEQINWLSQPLTEQRDRVIDLEGGERPAILGDQSIWWIMNDAGNHKMIATSPPLGMEVHVMAYAFDTGGDVGNTTFYQYRFIYRGSAPLEEAYAGFFADVDLGNYQNDWFGSDSTLGLAFYWNEENDDTGVFGYGPAPPAVGFDFVRGPAVPSAGDSAIVNNRAVRDHRNLSMTSNLLYHGGAGPNSDPSTALDHYRYMTGRWRDGTCITEGGEWGYASSDQCTRWYYAGDVGRNEASCQFWSECNNDGAGTNSQAADRRGIAGIGPFSMQPGDMQELVVAIVWARGANHFDSVVALKEADQVVQSLSDSGFEFAKPPEAPVLTAAAMDQRVVLTWTNEVESNNFLESYHVKDPLARPGQDMLAFEGYEVVQYSDTQDHVGEVIAVYDVPNGIQRILHSGRDGLRSVIASGTDQGVQTHHRIDGLTNYKTYHYGVRAYAYNASSSPPILRGPDSRVMVIPSKPTLTLSEAAVESMENEREADVVFVRNGVGYGRVTADVIDPVAMRDANYSVEFYALTVDKQRENEPVRPIDPPLDDEMRKHATASLVTYDIKRDDITILDGSATGSAAPQRKGVVLLDGLLFSVLGPIPDFTDFLVTANAAGPLDPPVSAILSGLDFPDPNSRLGDDITPQQTTAQVRWGIHAGGVPDGRYGSPEAGATFVGRVTRQGENTRALGPSDYEIRFTSRCANGLDHIVEDSDCLALRPFGQDDPAIIEVPFELWDTGIGTSHELGDDVRMIPAICDNELCGGGGTDGYFDIGGDHPAASGSDDPYSDWIYWYLPEDRTPGESGYQDYWERGGALEEVIARMVLVLEDGGSVPPYAQAYPEVGSVFRIETANSNQPGDRYSASTVGFGARVPDLSTARLRLEDIGIVPNPYRGSSAYETQQLVDEVRFTNLPDVATIRVFNLNGSLIRTLHKHAPGVPTLSWDLLTENHLPIGSGLYLIHIEVPEVGTTTLKFAVVNDQPFLNVY